MSSAESDADLDSVHSSESDLQIIDSENNVSTPSTSANNTQENANKRTAPTGRGRKISDIWGFFTNEKNPQSLKSAICKNCKLEVNHHKKSEYAKRHLLKCIPFKKAMYDLKFEERPEWFPSPKSFSGESSQTSTISRVNAMSSTNTSTVSINTRNNSVPGPSHSVHQTSMKSFAIPLMNEAEKVKFNENVAMFFYKTGTSFMRVEDENLLRAFNICRPGTTLPSRRQLATNLLDKCYENIKKQVTQSLPQNICIVSDAWTNVKGEPIVNYMAVAPTASFFLQSINTGSQGHTSQWLANDISRVIDSIPAPTVVSGAVTDNTAANKLAWKILEGIYPTKYFHGCVCHCLNLLVKDIFGEESKSKSTSNPHPLAANAAFAIECKNIVVFFKNHHSMNHQLKTAQKEKHVRGLVQPAKTRWGTLYGCFESLLTSEDILHTIVHSI